MNRQKRTRHERAEECIAVGDAVRVVNRREVILRYNTASAAVAAATATAAAQPPAVGFPGEQIRMLMQRDARYNNLQVECARNLATHSLAGCR